MNNLTTGAGSTNTTGSDGSSDFIDFYKLLDADVEATTTALRRRINDLYQEAQSNRDHRNPTKRRRYEALCELLPYCRIVLLDPDKRVRYDRYREQVESGGSVPPFETMMDEIAGRVDDGSASNAGEKIGLLAVKGDDDLLPNAQRGVASEADSPQRRAALFNKPAARGAAPAAPAQVAEAPRTTPQPTAPAPRQATPAAAPAEEATYQRKPRRVATPGLTPQTFAVAAFAVVALASYIFHAQFKDALLYGLIAGILAYVAGNALANSGNRNRVS